MYAETSKAGGMMGGDDRDEDDDSVTDVDSDIAHALSEETQFISRPQYKPLPGPLGKIAVEPMAEGSRPCLIVQKGPNKGARYDMRKPLIILGRVPDVADVVVQGDAASRHHAAIGHMGGSFTLYDLGSTNGTFAGGQQITQYPLAHGTLFCIADTEFIFELK